MEEVKEVKSISRTVDEQIGKLAKRKTTVNTPKIDFLLSQELDPKKRHILELIRDCSKVIIKTSILWWDKEQITGAWFCWYYKFCPTCAARRSMREIKYIQYHLWKKLDINKYHYYYAVVTIKSHPTITLKEVMNKILQWRDEIIRRRNNDRREAQKEKWFFAKAEWLMTSIEIVESTRWKWWNIHMNILFASLVDIPLKKRIDKNWKTQSTNFDLKEEWRSITKWESYITYMEKIAINKYAQMDIKKSKLSEVFKLSLIHIWRCRRAI